ncbi:MAG: hypothetical protein V4616_00270 [Bacteroidota bacterium]
MKNILSIFCLTAALMSCDKGDQIAQQRAAATAASQPAAITNKAILADINTANTVLEKQKAKGSDNSKGLVTGLLPKLAYIADGANNQLISLTTELKTGISSAAVIVYNDNNIGVVVTPSAISPWVSGPSCKYSGHVPLHYHVSSTFCGPAARKDVDNPGQGGRGATVVCENLNSDVCAAIFAHD